MLTKITKRMSYQCLNDCFLEWPYAWITKQYGEESMHNGDTLSQCGDKPGIKLNAAYCISLISMTHEGYNTMSTSYKH